MSRVGDDENLRNHPSAGAQSAGKANPGQPTEYVTLSPEEKAARSRRNAAIAFGLLAFIVLIFVTTVVRMSHNYNAGG